jgi:hypothetical protein
MTLWESTSNKAYVEHDIIHVVSTDQWKICLHEPARNDTHFFSQCKLVKKVISRHDQDGHRSATNNDALTGKFDVTTIELSAGRLQPPIEQL